MDGIIQFLNFWLLYLACATLAYWCWQQLFFWLRSGSEIRRFFHMLGAVLLFTPAPITSGSAFFAPAFVVFPFSILSTSLPQAMYAAHWLLGGLIVGASLLAISQLLRVFRRS